MRHDAPYPTGYKREAAQNEYRTGHRLSYLTDPEYTNMLRSLNELELWLDMNIPDITQLLSIYLRHMPNASKE